MIMKVKLYVEGLNAWKSRWWITRDARIIPDKKTLFADVNKSGEVNVSISIDHLDKLFI